jgi:hypothetical protein
MLLSAPAREPVKGRSRWTAVHPMPLRDHLAIIPIPPRPNDSDVILWTGLVNARRAG